MKRPEPFGFCVRICLDAATASIASCSDSRHRYLGGAMGARHSSLARIYSPLQHLTTSRIIRTDAFNRKISALTYNHKRLLVCVVCGLCRSFAAPSSSFPYALSSRCGNGRTHPRYRVPAYAQIPANIQVREGRKPKHTGIPEIPAAL